MALAIEPMLVLGGHQTRQLDDGWTVVTADGSWAAHFEHTVAITDDGPLVLTAEDGGASGFTALRAGGPAVLAGQPGRTGRGVLAGQAVVAGQAVLDAQDGPAGQEAAVVQPSARGVVGAHDGI
jgi:hypothetical protein